MVKKARGGVPCQLGGGVFWVFGVYSERGQNRGFRVFRVFRVFADSGAVESAVGGCRRVLFPQFRAGRATVGGYRRVNSGWARRGFGIGLSQEVGVLLFSVGKVLQ